ncbi:MAG: hypothetical protein EPN72_07770 [Nevskiaceae bacterium]|nr:MAG: hypothetical protein EPN63_04840 [Nevskiaceae bacterium]TBR73056.1 MAG: hypothetical protein EPN72_07770 [Nevskiaceae bacterium]
MKVELIRATRLLGVLLAMLAGVGNAHADVGLQPYVMANAATGNLQAQTAAVTSKLEAAGFKIEGSYSPYAGAQVIIITNDAMLKAAAAAKRMGGFGAVERVALTEVDGKIQISYLNPAYLAAAYQLGTDYADVAAALKTALGVQSTFGTKDGRTAEDLAKYHYMIGMEYFKDVYRLGTRGSHEVTVQAIEDNLKAHVGGAAFIYRLDISGTQQTLIGVSRAQVKDDAANDGHILGQMIDPNFAEKTTAYLPYEILVDGSDAVALHMRFRMAVWHPDLTMVTFGKIISSPSAIEKLLKEVVGGETKDSGGFM